MSQNQVRKFDLGDLETTSPFYGREKELQNLKDYISNGCRLIALLGMEGIGKTSLAVKLVNEIKIQKDFKKEFKYVIQESLRYSPSLDQLLISLIDKFPQDESYSSTQNIETTLLKLEQKLNKYPCLLLLDDVQEILQDREFSGQYREGYENYIRLFKGVGEVAHHNSCLVLISRDKPKDIEDLKHRTPQVKSILLGNLEDTAAKKILQEQGFSDSEYLTKLVNLYQGNPLYLMLVSTRIKESFGGSIYDFLHQGATLDFDNISELLDRQLERLSDLEKEIIYYLSSQENPISFEKLREITNYQHGLTNVIQHLVGCGLINNIAGGANYIIPSTVIINYLKRKNKA